MQFILKLQLQNLIYHKIVVFEINLIAVISIEDLKHW